MQNKKVNKIFIIILFFIFVILLNNKCFAWSVPSIETINDVLTDVDFESLCEEKNIDITEIQSVFVMRDRFKYRFYFTKFNPARITCQYYSYSGGYYDISLSSCTYFEYYWSVPRIDTSSFNNSFGVQASISLTSDVSYFFSSQDIYYNDTLIISDCGDYINGSIYENGYTPPSPIVYETPILYIDDMNLRKRFSFQFNIPMVRDDTKYYVFLEDYNRISYSSVSATFRIFTVTTPEYYDYTDYENYMYYDNVSKKLYLPAGCEIKEYSCTGNNGDTLSLTLENEFVASRPSEELHFQQSIWNSISSNVDTSDVAEMVLNNDLIPIDYLFNNFSVAYFLHNGLITSTLQKISQKLGFSVDDHSLLSRFFYTDCLFTLYYSEDKNLSYKDFCFSNHNIVSYENERHITTWDNYYYDLFRKTKIYNKENMLNTNMFSFQYTDSEDVSSLLPEGTSVAYLTSPFYQDNNNSSSGGYITYDVQEILQGDKIIDYSQEDNSIHNTFNADYIENYSEGDNIVINNYYTETIDKTSDSHLLHNIYLAILEIKTKMNDLGSNISNTTNNFTYNTENTVKYYFVPNSYMLDNIKSTLKTALEEHLGIIAQPFQRNTIYFYGFLRYCLK